MKATEPVASIKYRLTQVPPGADVALLVRHAEREEIPIGTFGEDVQLTSRGIVEAERLGRVLASRRWEGIVSSPLLRCCETAVGICRGAGWRGNVAVDRRLGDPGVFVVDPETAGPLFLSHGIQEIVRHQLHGSVPPPGMRSTEEGVKLLLELATSRLASGGRLAIYVTHDALLAVLVARLFRLRHDAAPWPDYLDGLLVWRSGLRILCSWRGLELAACPVGG